MAVLHRNHHASIASGLFRCGFLSHGDYFVCRDYFLAIYPAPPRETVQAADSLLNATPHADRSNTLCTCSSLRDQPWATSQGEGPGVF